MFIFFKLKIRPICVQWDSTMNRVIKEILISGSYADRLVRTRRAVSFLHSSGYCCGGNLLVLT